MAWWSQTGIPKHRLGSPALLLILPTAIFLRVCPRCAEGMACRAFVIKPSCLSQGVGNVASVKRKLYVWHSKSDQMLPTNCIISLDIPSGPGAFFLSSVRQVAWIPPTAIITPSETFAESLASFVARHSSSIVICVEAALVIRGMGILWQTLLVIVMYGSLFMSSHNSF